MSLFKSKSLAYDILKKENICTIYRYVQTRNAKLVLYGYILGIRWIGMSDGRGSIISEIFGGGLSLPTMESLKRLITSIPIKNRTLKPVLRVRARKRHL